jgi:hypothetical protein
MVIWLWLFFTGLDQAKEIASLAIGSASVALLLL